MLLNDVPQYAPIALTIRRIMDGSEIIYGFATGMPNLGNGVLNGSYYSMVELIIEGLTRIRDVLADNPGDGYLIGYSNLLFYEGAK